MTLISTQLSLSMGGGAKTSRCKRQLKRPLLQQSPLWKQVTVLVSSKYQGSPATRGQVKEPDQTGSDLCLGVHCPEAIPTHRNRQ